MRRGQRRRNLPLPHLSFLWAAVSPSLSFAFTPPFALRAAARARSVSRWLPLSKTSLRLEPKATWHGVHQRQLCRLWTSSGMYLDVAHVTQNQLRDWPDFCNPKKVNRVFVARPC